MPLFLQLTVSVTYFGSVHKLVEGMAVGVFVTNVDAKVEGNYSVLALGDRRRSRNA
jgi:hypothetical protein